MMAYLRDVHFYRVDTIIILQRVTNTTILSWKERKLDRLKSESKGAASEAPTCR